MKWIKYALIITALGSSGYLFYKFLLSPEKHGRKVFNSIKKGKFYYTQGYDGTVLVGMYDIATTRLIKHNLLESTGKYSRQAADEMIPRYFQLPTAVVNYQFLSSSNDTVSLLSSLQLDEVDFDSTMKTDHYSFIQYKNDQLKFYSKYKGFKFDSTSNLIIYLSDPVKKLHLKYRIETKDSVFLGTLIFINELNKYHLAALFLQPI